MKKQNSKYSLERGLIAAAGFLLLAVFTTRADYQSTVLADKPIAYFALDLTIDNSGTATDLSGNGNTSTYYNIYPVTGPSAYIPNAALFLGQSVESYVDLGSGANTGILNFGGPITMEAWVQSTNITQGPADILGKGYDSSQSYDEMVLRAQPGGSYFGGTYNNTNNGAAAVGGVQTTNWTYLVSTYDGTNWNLYENGVLVGQGADSVGAINFSDPWAIGVGSVDAGPAGGDPRYFMGNICQVALYTNALTSAQVLNHFCMGELGTSSSSSIPIIITQPQPQTAAYGGSATFTVQAVSALTTTNQWFKNGVPIAGKTNATLTLNNVSTGDATSYSVVVGNSNGTTNSISVSLTLVAANSLKWNTTGGSDVWDTTNTANWLNVSNSTQTVFHTFDQVLFDDTAGVSNHVTINGTVSPSLITVNSSTNNFTFAQGTSGALNGTGSLVKQGTSLLTIYTPAGLTGPVSVQGGTIYAGNNCFQNVASITVTNNATLDVGGGTFSDNKPITVSGMGVNGEGALYNSYADQPNELINVTLAGDTKFGSSARWDLASGSQIHGPHNLTIDFQDSAENYYGQWNSPVIGADLLGITLTNHTALGAVNMDSSFQNPGTVLTINTNCQLIFYSGGCNGSLQVMGGGQAYLWSAPSAINGSNITLEENAQWLSWGSSTNPEPVNSAIHLNGVAHIVIGDHNMVYTNVISGTGGFVADYWNHQMVLSASNTYSGPTIIGSDGNTLEVALTNNGSISHSSVIFFAGSDPAVAHMDVMGRPDQTLTLASGQTLAGVGGVNGSIVVSSGATLSPSGTNTALGINWTSTNAVGAIAASANITLNGTTLIKLDGSGTNDVVQAGGNIIYGGTLNLVNISSSSLAAGDSFQIFSAANRTGSFANITPATPGPGLAWDTSQLSSGIVSVVTGSSQPVIGSTTVSSGNLIFSGTGGTASGTYYVLTSTNLATPLTNWVSLSTNAFDSNGNFSVTNAVNPSNPQQFYLIKTP